MTSLLSANVRRLLTKYNLEVDSNSVAEDLTCTLCRKLMIDAYQTYCGCQYCRECIIGYLYDGDHFCRGGKMECQEGHLVLESNVVLNPRLNRSVLMARVHCPNQSCAYTIEVSCLEDHLRLCNMQSIECPYVKVGCDRSEGFGDTTLSHLQNDALAHSHLLVEYIVNLSNELERLKDKFEKCQLENENLSEETKIKDVQIQRIVETVECLKEESRKKEEEIVTLTKEVIKERDSVQVMVNYVRKSVEEVRVKREDVRVARVIRGSTTLPNYSADFIWKIDNFRKKFEGGSLQYGPSFYSRNYKLCLGFKTGTTNIHVLCAIMKGEYDDSLEWPMKLDVTLSIMDQCSGIPFITETLNYKSDSVIYKDAFDKPVSEINEDFGIFYCARYPDITRYSSVVMDDSLVLSCILKDPL